MLMDDIRGKTDFIVPILHRQRQRHKDRLAGGSYNEAMGLQRLQRERGELQAQLPPLRLVTSEGLGG